MDKSSFMFIEELSAQSEGTFIHYLDKYLGTDSHTSNTGEPTWKRVEKERPPPGFKYATAGVMHV